MTATTRREARAALLFLAPSFAGLLLFILLPVLASFVLSFTRWDLVTPPQAAGIANYRELLGFHRDAGGALAANDPDFWRCMGNTLIYLLNVPVGLALALALALALQRPFRGVAVLRTLYFLPVVTTLVAVSLLWRWIFNPDYGLMNWALGLAGLPGLPWLASTVWAKPAIMIVGLWKGMGYQMLIYLAALQGLPAVLQQAAELDGAGPWTRFWRITFPLLAPAHFFLLVVGLIGGFQIFDSVYVMTEGGPAGSTEPIIFYLYRKAFTWFEMGYASAIAWVLFAIMFAATLAQWRTLGRREGATS